MDRNLIIAFTTVAMAALTAMSLSTASETISSEPAPLASVASDFTRSAPPVSKDDAVDHENETDVASIDGAPVDYHDNGLSEEQDTAYAEAEAPSSGNSVWVSGRAPVAVRYARNSQAPSVPNIQMLF